MERPRPRSLAHSVSMPSGQSQPHQARPSKGMETSTNGHQMPQKANCARMVRLLKTDAALSGSGSSAGTISRNAYTPTTHHCNLRSRGAWSRRKSAKRAAERPSTAAIESTFKRHGRQGRRPFNAKPQAGTAAVLEGRPARRNRPHTTAQYATHNSTDINAG